MLDRPAEAREALGACAARTLAPHDRRVVARALADAERRHIGRFYTTARLGPRVGAARLAVRYVGAERGRGVVACGPVAPGDVIFTETPLVSHRRPGVREHLISCDACMRSRDDAPVAWPSCTACGTTYCSDACRTAAWTAHHRILCAASADTLRRLRELCRCDTRCAACDAAALAHGSPAPAAARIG